MDRYRAILAEIGEELGAKLREETGEQAEVALVIRYDDPEDGENSIEFYGRGDKVQLLGAIATMQWKLAQDTTEGPNTDSYKIKEDA